jgi:GNAT superfamily N-acetyltransferase
MCLALPRCASGVVADHARAHPVPNCGVVELDVGDSGWTLRQWPGDPDRAPHPGDLIDLVGRAAAQWVRVSADGSAVAAADIGAVPCASFDVDEPWATHATVTGVVDAPTPTHLREITDWLQATRPGSWQVRARAEQRDALVEQGLVPALELGVWVTDRRPRYTLPDGVEVGEAADVDEFVAVYGDELAPIVVGQLGRTGRDFLMLRERGRPVGCARVTEVSGTAYVSAITVLAEHRGRGLGRLISAAATARAVRQAGLAWLHCEDAMSVLYEQVGYRRLTSHVHLGPGELR